MDHVAARSPRTPRLDIPCQGRWIRRRWFAIITAGLVAIDSLLDIPAYPFWSLAIFALSLWIIKGLLDYQKPEDSGWEATPSGATREPASAPRPPL